MRIASAIFALSLLLGCGDVISHIPYSGPEIDAYDGPLQSDEDVAIIVQDNDCGRHSCVKAITTSKKTLFAEWKFRSAGLGAPRKIRLLPGEYRISLEFSWSQWSPRQTADGQVNLLRGRTYDVVSDDCRKIWNIIRCWGRAEDPSFVWMEESDSGKVILGERPW